MRRYLNRARAWYATTTPGKRKDLSVGILSVLIGGLFALLIGLTNKAMSPTASNSAVPYSQAQAKFTDYTVASGEFIISIAQMLGVPWESIVIANEATLKANTKKYCANRSRKYTHRRGRRGHFCNFTVQDENGQPLVFANTLMPGDVLRIPSATAPAVIQQAITGVRGRRVAIVIDDTGSMRDDRERVSAWYMQAVHNAGKQIVKVVLYADGYVRELDAGAVVFFTSGGFENTRAALERATRYQPDAIVLVSDEPGDDWNGFRNLRLPPIIAHSLHPSADRELNEVARLTAGKFLSSHAGPMGFASLAP